mmetsp:Transcript_6990/g.10668  ORF Transcript_6990/g.10668 Transcript_6990/m.10668 type:complete len:332 (+) Transcript_6990:70-1065(+)
MLLFLALFLLGSCGLEITGPKEDQRAMFNHRTGDFGQQEPYEVVGTLVTPNEQSLCSKVGDDENFNNSIVLAIRGNCTFYLKAVHAMNAGASAVVIGNNYTNDDEIFMSRSDGTENLPEVTIPTVFINGIDYAEILEYYAEVTSGNQTLTAELNQKGDVGAKRRPKFHILPPIILMSVWVSIIGMYFCRKVLVRYVSRQNRMAAMRDVPTVPYQEMKEEDTGDNNDDSHSDAPQRVLNSRCVICMEDFVEGEDVKVLPCGHGFHAHCIDPWLANQSDRCPLCNQSLFIRRDQDVEVELKALNADGRNRNQTNRNSQGSATPWPQYRMTNVD